MNVESPLANYIQKIIDSVATSKVLYLDGETRGIISQLLSQTQALSQDVFLIHQLGVDIKQANVEQNIAHLCAIIFVRPNNKNIDEIVKHLRNPKHSSYYLFFSNRLDETSLSRLAQADQYEVVQQVQELFADVYPINRDLFYLNQSNQYTFIEEQKSWNGDSNLLNREIDGLTAMLLAVKKRPLIRWSKSSTIAKKIADEIRDVIQKENKLFGWQEPSIKPLLLILDRKNDPITPLLCQWTYQAMVHQCLEIKNSRVDMRHLNPKNKQNEEVVMNPFNDEFFRHNKNKTFGDLGAECKKLVDKFSKQVKGAKNVKSIEDMQKFVENYPEYLAESGNVSKHVAVLTELSRIVSKRKLLDVSAIEQEIVCNDDPKNHFNEVERLILNPQIDDFDKLRLAIIYCLRYEAKGKDQRSRFRNLLRNNIKNEKILSKINLLDIMLRYFNSQKRDSNLFAEEKNDNFFDRVKGLVKSPIQGVDNIYIQHKPLLDSIITDSVNCKLPLHAFSSFQGTHKQSPEDIIIYVVGGASYAESSVVTQKNKEFGKKVNIILGSSFIHNQQTFLDGIQSTYGKTYGNSGLQHG